MKATKKQTAVGWLLEELRKYGSPVPREFKEKAKEMEKEQIIDFSKHCLDKAKDLDILTSYKNIEQYYNDTYETN